MRRTDLTEALMAGWSRLDVTQRERFFRAFVAAALRLDRLELRAWIRRKLQYPPLAAPVDMSRLLADTDITLLLKAARIAPREAAAVPDRDEADGG